MNSMKRRAKFISLFEHRPGLGTALSANTTVQRNMKTKICCHSSKQRVEARCRQQNVLLRRKHMTWCRRNEVVGGAAEGSNTRSSLTGWLNFPFGLNWIIFYYYLFIIIFIQSLLNWMIWSCCVGTYPTKKWCKYLKHFGCAKKKDIIPENL